MVPRQCGSIRSLEAGRAAKSSVQNLVQRVARQRGTQDSGTCSGRAAGPPASAGVDGNGSTRDDDNNHITTNVTETTDINTTADDATGTSMGYARGRLERAQESLV